MRGCEFSIDAGHKFSHSFDDKIELLLEKKLKGHQELSKFKKRIYDKMHSAKVVHLIIK